MTIVKLTIEGELEKFAEKVRGESPAAVDASFEMLCRMFYYWKNLHTHDNSPPGKSLQDEIDRLNDLMTRMTTQSEEYRRTIEKMAERQRESSKIIDEQARKFALEKAGMSKHHQHEIDRLSDHINRLKIDLVDAKARKPAVEFDLVHQINTLRAEIERLEADKGDMKLSMELYDTRLSEQIKSTTNYRDLYKDYYEKWRQVSDMRDALAAELNAAKGNSAEREKYIARLEDQLKYIATEVETSGGASPLPTAKTAPDDDLFKRGSVDI